ncbi:MAG: penicillin-binding protein 1C [Gammaproteobacteria bacterium]
MNGRPRHRRIAAAGCALLLAGVTVLHVTRPTTPDFDTVRAGHRPSERLLLARDGTPLHALRTDPRVRRAPWVSLADVSPALRATVVAVEDRRFATHHGVDWRALAGAAWRAAQGERLRGASTLTMQVAALLDPSLARGDRTVRQKWRQMRTAWALEHRWTKTRILETYLNLAGFRGEIVGIGAASRVLLGKSPATLDADDALLLAVLLRSPNASPAALAARGCRLRARLALAGDCAALRTRAAALTNAATADVTRGTPQLARHVAQALLPTAAGDVRATLDATLQRVARDALRRQLARLGARHVADGAVLVLDNATAEVRAYVGNGAPHASASHVDGVRALRQAGSTLKPLLYHLALEQRLLTAASLLDDRALALATPRGEYVPQNYDRVFQGLVSVRSSLAGSLNIPAVRTLMLIGPEAFLARLRAYGFRDLAEDANHYGYALALGAPEVTLWDLVNAYRQLARGGPDGRAPRLRPACPAGACAEPPGVTEDALGAAYIVGDILSDRGSRSASFGLENPLATTFRSAVKTGTSKHMRDNWCIGYGARHTVGVWVGNFDGSPMRDVSGLTGAAPVWAEIAQHLAQDDPGLPASPPGGVARTRVSFSGTAEAARDEWFLAGTAQTEVRPVSSARTPRIVYPGRHGVLALDPDIPAEHQRVFFTMEPLQPGFTWRLDGERFAETPDRAAWAPAPGEHRLTLVAANGRVVDALRFKVRGGSR